MRFGTRLINKVTGSYGVNPGPIPALVAAFKARVIADGGSIEETTNNLTTLLNQLNGVVPNFTNTCKLFVAPHLGNKVAAGTGATSGNRAANKLYNIFGSSGDLVQATAANQPLLLVHSGVNYAYLPGINSNYFSTPSAIGNDLTNDFGIETYINPLTLAGSKTIEGKYSGSNATSQQIFYLSGNTLKLDVYQPTAGNTYTSSAIPFAANVAFYARVSRNATTGIIKFFTSSDGVNFTQLGTNISGVTGSLNSPSRILEIGSIVAGSANVFTGLIYYVKLFKDDTFTTPTQIFNPQLYNRSVSQTTIPSSTGEVWTLNTPATNNALKTAIVDKTMTMGNGTSYGMQAPSFNLVGTAFTRYTVFRKFVNNVGSQIINELGSAIASNQGLYLAINSVADNEEYGINAGGLNNSRYTSNSILMKVATSVVNINNADEATPYLINNSAQVLVAKDSTFNNTNPMNATGYNLLARNNASSLRANATVFADLIFEGEHDSTTRTNVYNILKTYFNLP